MSEGTVSMDKSVQAEQYEIEDKDMQIMGLDIVVKVHVRIQVKCDYMAGVGDGCTGNLFVQVAECNPSGAF